MDYADLNIFHAEDDSSDIELFRRVLETIHFDGKYKHFSSGDSLFDYIVKEGKQNTPQFKLPNLIFLDIGLPGNNGKEILRALKQDARFSRIPILMLSGSNSERDYLESISYGCNGYILKCSDWENYCKICTVCMNTWSLIQKQRFV